MTNEEKEKATGIARREFEKREANRLIVSSQFGTVVGITPFVQQILGRHWGLDTISMYISNKIRDFNFRVIDPLTNYILILESDRALNNILESGLTKLDVRFIINQSEDFRTIKVLMEIYPLSISEYIIIDADYLRYPNRGMARTQEEYDNLIKLSPCDMVNKIVDQLIEQFQYKLIQLLLKIKINQYGNS